MKQFINILTTTFVVLLALFSLFLIGIRLFGYNVFAVMSGSMEPTFHTGALVYTEQVDIDEIKVGDPITFMLNEDTIVTHRVSDVLDDNGTKRFVTKGDANEYEDGAPVHENNVIGVARFSIPLLGYLSIFLQTIPGKCFALAFIVGVIWVCFLPKRPTQRTSNEQCVT